MRLPPLDYPLSSSKSTFPAALGVGCASVLLVPVEVDIDRQGADLALGALLDDVQELEIAVLRAGEEGLDEAVRAELAEGAIPELPDLDAEGDLVEGEEAGPGQGVVADVVTVVALPTCPCP